MKNKAVIIALCCVLLAAFALGATGAVSLVSGDETESTTDRLLGVFITREYPTLLDTADDGRLYAEAVSDEGGAIEKFVFGIDGIAYFAAKHTDKNGDYWKAENGGVSDSNAAYSTADSFDGIELSGTLYARAAKLVFNPVYQTSDGRVYMVSGTAMAMDDDISGGFSMTDEHSVTVAGKSETVSTSVKISLRHMAEPASASVVQFDAGGSVLSRQSYAAGELPDKLTAQEGAAYIIVESSYGDGSVTRELFEPEDDGIFAFFCRDDGVCVKQHCTVAWE